VAAFPVATASVSTSRAIAANAGVRPADDTSYTVIDLGASANVAVSGATAFAINNNNQVVGDYYRSGGDSHAFIWNPSGPSTGVMSDLGIGGGSHAYGINDRGRVVGQGAGGAYIAIPPPTSGGPYTVTTLVGGGRRVRHQQPGWCRRYQRRPRLHPHRGPAQPVRRRRRHHDRR